MTAEPVPGEDFIEALVARNPQLRGNPMALAMLCRAFIRQGKIAQALALGRAATAMAPVDMAVRDRVRATLSRGVPRYHHAMLDDGPRNRAYAQAIARAVRPGMKVLEIGTGSGLLAMLAARAGATVVTCESNRMVAATAAAIVAANGYSDRVRVVAKPSTALEIGVDLDAPADLLVSEIFGNTLFDEGVVAALADAKARLMAPGAVIVPPRAELRCALFESRDRRRPQLGEVEGFDLSLFNLLTHPIAGHIGKDRAAEQRSDAATLLAMDFSAQAPFGPASESVTLASHGGRVDAVAQWLRIDFGDGNVIENDPFGPDASHWKAPVFELPEELETQAGDRITLSARHLDRLLTVSAARAR